MIEVIIFTKFAKEIADRSIFSFALRNSFELKWQKKQK